LKNKSDKTREEVRGLCLLCFFDQPKKLITAPFSDVNPWVQVSKKGVDQNFSELWYTNSPKKSGFFKWKLAVIALR
jgi:hypothetical protein